MLTLRIEFVHEEERAELIEELKEIYYIIEESKIIPSRKENSKRKLQFLEIEKKLRMKSNSKCIK